jgi:HEAT repeat protein
VEPAVPEGETGRVTEWDLLDNNRLVAAPPAAGIRSIVAWAAEVGRRGLPAAVPGLEALCRRFAGFGVEQIVPEQASALDALSQIGGIEAREAVARLISRKIVLGPSLPKALAAAARLQARLPADVVCDLLRYDRPQVRADACRLVRSWPETAPLLFDLLEDLDSNVRMAAACALGRLGRSEVRSLLAGFLRIAPSAELIDAIAGVADEECIILLGRAARAAPDLSQAVLDVLGSIDDPRAEEIATAIRNHNG